MATEVLNSLVTRHEFYSKLIIEHLAISVISILIAGVLGLIIGIIISIVQTLKIIIRIIYYMLWELVEKLKMH